MTTQAIAPKVLDDLILARLLVVGKRPLGPGKLRDDINRLRASPPSAEQWQATLLEMEEAGLVTRKPLGLTDAGRQRALAFLGLEALPPKSNWGTVQAKYLIPQALGAADPAARKRLSNANNLRAAVLRKTYALGIPETTGVGATVEAAAAKLIGDKLGLQQQSTLKAVMQAFLQQLLGSTTPLDGRKLQESLPGHALGATRGGMQGLRDAILLRWLDTGDTAEPGVSAMAHVAAPMMPMTKPTQEEPRQTDLDLTTFAATVQAVARNCPTGRWGDNKVFINQVWRQLQLEPTFPRFELAAFKERLVEAHQRGLLKLERADLVEAMSPDDVREAETAFLTATYHFILIERNLS